MTRHHIFRRQPWQRHLRCVGCGYVARDKGAHIAHGQTAAVFEPGAPDTAQILGEGQ